MPHRCRQIRLIWKTKFNRGNWYLIDGDHEICADEFWVLFQKKHIRYHTINGGLFLNIPDDAEVSDQNSVKTKCNYEVMDLSRFEHFKAPSDHLAKIELTWNLCTSSTSDHLLEQKLLDKFDEMMKLILGQNRSWNCTRYTRHMQLELNLFISPEFIANVIDKVWVILENHKEVAKLRMNLDQINTESDQQYQSNQKMVRLMRDNKHIKQIKIFAKQLLRSFISIGANCSLTLNLLEI